MRDTHLPYGHQLIDDADIQAVVEALKADKITTGERVEQFEKKVASYCGAKYAVAVSSGTAALHCAYHVAGISRGDEVITTPITFFATVSAIVMCGGKPILADVREDTINIDFFEIARKIRHKTKAIVPVDFAGHPASLDVIMGIAKGNNLVVIEDACHALGAEYKGKKIGSISDMTVFSFHPVKSITTGEGGMILTNNESYYEKMLKFRNHNIEHGTKPWQYGIWDVGYNYRLSDISCALGISQMDKLDKFITRRRKIARMYNEAFADIEEIITPVELPLVKSAYHLYVIQLRSMDREKFMESLVSQNIGVQVHYIPIHYHPYMQKNSRYRIGDFPNAERYYSRCISLSIFPKMTDDDVEYVIDTVKNIIGVK